MDYGTLCSHYLEKEDNNFSTERIDSWDKLKINKETVERIVFGMRYIKCYSLSQLEIVFKVLTDCEFKWRTGDSLTNTSMFTSDEFPIYIGHKGNKAIFDSKASKDCITFTKKVLDIEEIIEFEQFILLVSSKYKLKGNRLYYYGYAGDLMQIGKYIHNILNDREFQPVKLIKTGSKFYYKFGNGSVTPRLLSKVLHFGNMSLDVFKYVLSNLNEGVSKPFFVRDNNAQCKIQIINTVSERKTADLPLSYRDIQKCSRHFIVVSELESLQSGAGLELLQTIMSLSKDIPVVLIVDDLYGGSFKILPYSPNCIPKHLDTVYSDIGFRDISEYVGYYNYVCNYDDTRTMIYCNDELFNKIVPVSSNDCVQSKLDTCLSNLKNEMSAEQ